MVASHGHSPPPRLRRAYFECRHGQLHVHNAIPVGRRLRRADHADLPARQPPAPAGCSSRFRDGSGNSRSIYSPDLPGCGESDAPPRRRSSIAGYAEAIADFLDSMRFRQVDLLGVGSGAAVAAELAMRGRRWCASCSCSGVALGKPKRAVTRPVGAEGRRRALQARRRHRLDGRAAGNSSNNLVLRPDNSGSGGACEAMPAQGDRPPGQARSAGARRQAARSFFAARR